MLSMTELKKQVNGQYTLDWQWWNFYCEQKMYFVVCNGERVSDPCIHEYAKRDMNHLKHNYAIELLGMKGYTYDQFSDYDCDNIGYPDQQYFSPWFETVKLAIKRYNEDNEG